MEPKAILLSVIFIVMAILLWKYISKDATTLTSITSAESPQTIAASSLDGSTNFSYSVWIYINDWNYRYGEPKVIFSRSTGSRSACPAVSLGATENDLTVTLSTFAGSQAKQTIATKSNSTINHVCRVRNIALQKWVNIILSCSSRTMDIYLDGKLVNTCMLPGIPNVDATAPIQVTPNGGFNGYTSTMQYLGYACDPQQAWSIYSKGYGASTLGQLFGSYSLQISLLQGTTATNTVTL